MTRTPPARDDPAKANDPKATGPVPGSPTSSRTTACPASSRQAAPAAANRSAPDEVDAGRLAPGHEPLAAADPGERALPGQGLQQRAGIRDGDGTRDERHGGRSCCHRRSA